MPKVVEGDFRPEGAKVAIVAARFNDFIVDHLVGGAVDALVRHGVADDDITVYRCPGAWELPAVVKKAAASGRYSAVIALGAVIRGGTPHFDYVSTQVARGVGEVTNTADIPVTFGVLTCDTIEQAIERSGTKAGNKGVEAAMAAIEMIQLFNAMG